MQGLSCPWCNSLLPDAISTQVCATCGKTLCSVTPTASTIAQSSETSALDPDVTANTAHSETPSHSHRVLFSFSHFSLLPKGSLLPKWWNSHPQKHENGPFAERTAFSIPLNLDPLEDEKPFTGPLQDQISEEDDLSQVRPNGQLTWQKVVEHSPQRQSYVYPPRPVVPENERVGVPARVLAAHLSSSSFVLRMKQISPKMLFWIITAILLLIISLFGITSTFGYRQVSPADKDARLSLQITPNELSAGAIMTLRGDHFSPHASIGLTRDNAIPIADTSGALSTQADNGGHFTDTIFVGDDWGDGLHTIRAEDSVTHKVASFPIRVNGEGTPSTPPLLHLSVDSLDFGSGDQATNSTQTLTLSNSGGSQITWQASTSDPWLLITPTEGNFTHAIPQKVTVAVDRSKLQTGFYSSQLHFHSNGGDVSIAVSMQVIPLKPGHSAIIQVSPAVLSFVATDGTSTTDSQQITISDFGGQAMHWSASADVPWLTISPSSMTVASGSFTTAQVSVTSGNLLPGVYTGTLTFTAQNSIGNDSVFHSPQEVVVSITILPPCTLFVGSAIVDFSSVYLQSGPSPQTIDVTASSGCTSPLNWNAKSNANWLTLNNTQGTTPSTLSIGINVATLTPNTYTGTLTLSSPVGTQVVVVRFTLSPPGPPLLVTTPSSVTINVPGTTSSSINLDNTGGSPLNWSATLQSGAPAWLSLSPASGSNLAAGAMASCNLVVNANGVASGSYSTNVTITATDAISGQPVAGSPVTVPITITIAPPSMQVSTTNMAFSTVTGGAVNSQSLTITNIGGGTLTWTASFPTQPWLLVNATAGSATLGTSSMLVFSIQTNGLPASSTAYTDRVVITPSSGNAVTINISLLITNPTSTPPPPPNVTPTVTALPSASPTVTPSPTAIVWLTPMV